VIAITGCESVSPDALTSPSPAVSPSPNAAALQAVIVSSASSSGPCGGVACVVAGPAQRIGFFITEPDGGVVSGATVTAQVFSVAASATGQGQTATALGPEVAAAYHGAGIENANRVINRGVYTITQDLPRAGQYGLVVKATKDAVAATSRASFLVLAADPGIAVGTAAPRSKNQTAGEVKDIATIDTGVPPDDMHYISIADAIAAHHPVVAYMGTPGFCQSRTCAPEVAAVKVAEAELRPKGVDFVHVETYAGGRPDNADVSKATLTATFMEWKLDTEPWVILVDKNGNVAAKFSGATGGDEIIAAAAKLV
jgi:hypothetical protein